MVRPRKNPPRERKQQGRGRPLRTPGQWGKTLDAIRAALGLSAPDFQALLQVSPYAYHRWRKADDAPKSAIKALTMFARVNPDYLTGASSEMFLTSDDVPALDKVRFAAQAHILTAFADALTPDEKQYAAKLARHFD